MEQNVNLLVEQFRQELLDKIQRAPFPPAVSYYITKDVFRDIENQYFGYLESIKREIQMQNIEAAAATEETDSVVED